MLRVEAQKTNINRVVGGYSFVCFHSMHTVTRRRVTLFNGVCQFVVRSRGRLMCLRHRQPDNLRLTPKTNTRVPPSSSIVALMITAAVFRSTLDTTQFVSIQISVHLPIHTRPRSAYLKPRDNSAAREGHLGSVGPSLGEPRHRA